MSGAVVYGRGVSGILRALGIPPASGRAARFAQLERALADAPDDGAYWLALAVRGDRLPLWDDVVAFRRAVRADGLGRAWGRIRRPLAPRRRARIVGRATLVDVHHTASSALATGVQRVARAVVERLVPRGADPVGWGSAGDRLLLLPADRVLAGRRTSGGRAVIPWNCGYLLPEVVTDERRSARISALARASHGRSVAIGMDAIPLTTAETAGLKMPGVFARHLVAMAAMDVVLPISHAAGREYAGWASMLPAAGLEPPRVTPIPIAATAGVPDPNGSARLAEVMTRLGGDSAAPLVLCVGSHEPRKNHDAVLVAAELLWREGARFRLLFVGGNAWRSETFTRRLGVLRDGGRPVLSARGIPDGALWALYREASFTLFPSLNEGFGLPITESLLSGTPVVTSDFGSMRELAADGGCVLVDPRDERSIADGMRRLLVDDALRSRLAAEAAAVVERSWDEYAAQVAAELMP